MNDDYHSKAPMTNYSVLILLVVLNVVLSVSVCKAAERTDLSGTVTYNGEPVIAMVLANGKYMFTVGGEGRFDLTDVPFDTNDGITLYAFCSGLSPYKTILDQGVSDFEIHLTKDSEASQPVVTIDTLVESESRAGWFDISGTITNQSGILLCAMVLANGQYMFTCGSSSGEYALTVPMDSNGQVTIYGFCSGLSPYKETIDVDDYLDGIEPHTIHFTGEELLGIPTANSIAINIVPDETIEYYYQYGTSPGVYTEQTSVMIADADQPHEIVINDLTSNTKYFYKMRYRVPDSSWITRDEYSFQTQRTVGEPFVFTITADPHARGTEDHIKTMSNLIDDQADFHIDLGDTFMVDNLTSQEEVNAAYLVQRDPIYFGGIGHYAPIFLAIGNHEEEEGWNFDDLPFSTALASVQARKAFFPTPIDQGSGGFYSGNTDILSDIDETIYGDQYREDYYAWEWGDALFVVIDPFHYTMELPYQQGTAGEGYDDPVTGDQWTWTLGAQQFNWFKQTLENSNAKYKFVFSHNVTGGILRSIIDVDPGYVRGGAEAAAYFEWGGYNADGTWGFSDHRDPDDFGDTPIHQIMVNNNVSAYFHGHDHMFAYEIRDGIVYQEVPSAGYYVSFEGIYDVDETDPDYDTIAVFMYMLGHLRVTVTPDEATVEFVRSSSNDQFTNQFVRYTYTIAHAE